MRGTISSSDPRIAGKEEISFSDMYLVPILRKQRQESCKFEARIDYLVNLGLYSKTISKQINKIIHCSMYSGIMNIKHKNKIQPFSFKLVLSMLL